MEKPAQPIAVIPTLLEYNSYKQYINRYAQQIHLGLDISVVDQLLKATKIFIYIQHQLNVQEQQWKSQAEIDFWLWNILLACPLSVERLETSVCIMEVCGLICGGEK